MTADLASRRIRRALGGAIGAASIVFGALAIPPAFQQSPLFAPWWPFTFITLVLVLPAVVAIGALADLVKVMRAAAWALTFALPLAAITWLPAMINAPLIPSNESHWLAAVSAVATSVACLILRRRWAWSYLVLVCLLLGALRLLTSTGDEHVLIAIEDTLYMILFCGMMTAAILAVQRAGRILDASIARSAEEAAHIAQADARARENARFDALVHDEILSTLVGVLRQPTPSGELVTQARRALARVEELDNGTGMAAHSGEQFADRLREAVADISPRPVVTAAITAGRTIPRPVCVALTDATAEALRNAIRHSGASSIVVQAHVDDSGAGVVIADDGAGFDPSVVDDSRLGVRLSIVGRMESVPGGSAVVASRPGSGTRVELQWRP